MSQTAGALALDPVEMPQVGDIWKNRFGWDCLVVEERPTGFFRYEATLRNGTEYTGMFETRDVLEGTVRKEG